MRTRGWKEEEIGCGDHYDRTTIESGRLAGLDGSTRSRRSAVSLLCLCCHPHGRVVTVLYAMIDCAVTMSVFDLAICVISKAIWFCYTGFISETKNTRSQSVGQEINKLYTL